MLSSTGFAANAHNARPPRRAVAFSFMRPCSGQRGARPAIVLFLLAFLFGTAGASNVSGGNEAGVSSVRLPLQFIANAGQWPKEVCFGALRGRDKVAFTREGLVLWTPHVRPDALPQGDAMPHGVPPLGAVERLELRFVAPSPDMRVEEMGEEVTRTNFYLGDDRRAWREGVGAYRGVRYTNVWPGIDVEYEEGAKGLLQRVVLHPGADARRIAFTGAPALLRTIAPEEAWSGSAARSAGSDAVAGDTARVRPYRNFFEKRKVIETEFTSCFGGSAAEYCFGFDVDAMGNIYILLYTYSGDLPVNHVGDSTLSGPSDLYVASLSSDSRRLRFGTYIGGSDVDFVGDAGGACGYSRRALRCTDSSVHVMCDTRSTDFPMLQGGHQDQRPTRLCFPYNSATALVRFDLVGRMNASTWIGNPTAFTGRELWTDNEDNIVVFGHSEREQNFITKGSLMDSVDYDPVSGNGPTYWNRVGALLKLRNDYSGVVAGTFLYAYGQAAQASSCISPILRTDSKNDIILMLPYHLLDSVNTPLPMINHWDVVGGGTGDYLLKVSSDLKRFLIVSRVNTRVANLDLDASDGIVIVGHDRMFFNSSHLVNAMSSESASYQILRFPSAGGAPIFSTYHPFSGNNASGYHEVNVFVTKCQEILILSMQNRGNLPFRNPLDTLNNGGAILFLKMDTTGQVLRHLGYWHLDEKYPVEQTPKIGIGTETEGSRGYGKLDQSDNLLYYFETTPTDLERITPLRSNLEFDIRGVKDGLLVRTRVPGCELLSCGLDMVDTVRLAMDEGMVQPQFAELRVDLANIDPVIDAAGIECVLTLPPGLALDPDTQRARVALPGLRLRPGEVHTLAWRVRIDTSVFSREGD